MGSIRFPGKVLRPLAGKPVLWHVVHRLRQCVMLDEVAIATSVEAVDDPLVAFAVRHDVPLVRGPEENVLKRFEMAIDQFMPDVVLRVTGDAPLVDPAMIERLLNTLIREDAGYCVVDPSLPCIHEGFSPFTTWAFRKLVTEAGDDPVAREHVTAYFKEHLEFVPTAYAELPESEQFFGARVSVDNPADIDFLEAVHTRLGVKAGELDVRDVVRLLRSEPELLAINGHVHQKCADEETRRAVIRCDGGSRVGMGHVVRCLAFADELRERHGVGVTFAMMEDELGIAMVKQSGYRVEQGCATGDEALWMEGVLCRTAADLLIMDFRTDLDSSHVARWRARGVLIVTIDDPSDRRLAADLAFYPPVPQVKRMDWSGFSGTLYSGWEWVILRRQFAQAGTWKLGHVSGTQVSDLSPHLCVLVAMGGSDPAGLTLEAVRALKQIDECFQAVIVLGRAYCDRTDLDCLLRDASFHFEIRTDAQEMVRLMSEVDMAVASFGVTSYELASVGVPGVYLALTSDHSESCSAFEDAGSGINLGVHAEVTTAQLAGCIRSLLIDPAERTRMHERCRQLLDGCAAERMAGMCHERLALIV